MRKCAVAPTLTCTGAMWPQKLAARAIADRKFQKAQNLIKPHPDTAARSENAALLSTLMMLSAEAPELSGRGCEAATVRLDSPGWARYGFGTKWAVRAKLREIKSLGPLK